jgi:acetyl-CoA synthetase
MSEQFLTASLPELEQFSADIKSHADLYKFSIEHNDEFWSVLAKSRLEWFQPFEQVRSGNFSDAELQLKWFLGGKLNVSVNCVDRHFLKNPDKVALIWEKDEPNQAEYVTYEQLYKTMNQVANMLREYGVGKGDRVAIYMPTSSLTAAVMLACARIGAIHSVIFAGFSAESLASRINDCK